MTGAALTPAFTDKLVKVLAMLGSVHDGEVASAGRRAHAMLRSAGVTWVEVIAPPHLPAPSAPRRHCCRPVSVDQAVTVGLRWRDALNDWEVSFLRSIAGRERLSDKQTAALNRILDKVEAFVVAKGTECHSDHDPHPSGATTR